MEFAPDTINVLDYLEAYSGEGLRKRNDLGLLFELTARSDAYQQMNDLLFHGSHLYRLYGTLRRTGGRGEGSAALEKEFREGAERLRDLIALILVDADEEYHERFNQTYYAMTQGSLRNLVDLAHDLNRAKGLQNEQKFSGERSRGDNHDVDPSEKGEADSSEGKENEEDGGIVD